MPQLTHLMQEMLRVGPVFPVTVEPILTVQELMRQDGEKIPKSTVLALVDTGASASAVQASILEHMALDDVGEYFMSTPSTTEPVMVLKYRVRLALSSDIIFETYVAGVPMGGQPAQCLIGRDILQYIEMTYSGPKRTFTISVTQQDEAG